MIRACNYTPLPWFDKIMIPSPLGNICHGIMFPPLFSLCSFARSSSHFLCSSSNCASVVSSFIMVLRGMGDSDVGWLRGMFDSNVGGMGDSDVRWLGDV